MAKFQEYDQNPLPRIVQILTLSDQQKKTIPVRRQDGFSLPKSINKWLRAIMVFALPSCA